MNEGRGAWKFHAGQTMKPVRLKQMEQYILQHDFVSLDALCEYFQVSKNTVRSDVNELVKRGSVEKKYGGVQALTVRNMSTFHERQIKNIDDKLLIGKCAAQLIEENDIIFVDSGTTTASIFSEEIELPSNVTVITNNLTVINQYERYHNMDVIALPGKLNPKTKSFFSLETLDFIQKFNIRKAFIAATGISMAGGLTNSTSLEAELKEKVIQVSDKVILVADSSKVGKTAMINYANLDDISIWICDENNKEQVDNLCLAHNVEVMYAGK